MVLLDISIHSFTFHLIIPSVFILTHLTLTPSIHPFIYHSPLSPFIHPLPLLPYLPALSLPIHPFTHSPTLFTNYLIRSLPNRSASPICPFTKLTHPLIQPSTDSPIHTSTFSHSLIYLVNYNQFTQSFRHSIIYSFGSLTISSIAISFIHFIVYSLGPAIIPQSPILSFTFFFHFFSQSALYWDSFIQPFTLLTHPFTYFLRFPLRCRLDVLLTFYLDKSSCTELAEVGLETLQYPGRVWPGEPGSYWFRALLLYKGRFWKPFRTWRSSVRSLHSVAIGYSPVGM